MITPYKASPGLEAFIRRITPPHCGAWSTAPSTYAEMVESRQHHNIFVVSKANQSRTIFSSREVNLAMRAWHDSVHYAYQLDFSVEDELAVADIMQSQLVMTDELETDDRRAVWFDTAGQTMAHHLRGGFPFTQDVYVAFCFRANGNFAEAVRLYETEGFLFS